MDYLLIFPNRVRGMVEVLGASPFQGPERSMVNHPNRSRKVQPRDTAEEDIDWSVLVAAGQLLRNAQHQIREKQRRLDEAIALAPQLARPDSSKWRSVSDQRGMPTEGKVWVSDGERVWDIWARGGIPATATACKYWLDEYTWPTPPTAERKAELAALSPPRNTP